MPTALIGAAITGGSSIIGGLLNKPKKTVAQPLYTQPQLEAQSQLGTSLSDELAHPTSLAPEKVAAASNINKDYADAGTRLDSELAGRGFGNSGKLVTNHKTIDVARAGAMGGLESQFAALDLDQKNKTRSAMQQFAFSGPGSTVTSSPPGGVVGGAVSGGAETASMLYALNHFMNGGGGADAGGDPQASENWNPDEAEAA